MSNTLQFGPTGCVHNEDGSIASVSASLDASRAAAPLAVSTGPLTDIHGVLASAPQSVGKVASGPVVSRDSSGRQWVDEPQSVEPVTRLVRIGDTTTPANRLATLLTEALGPSHPAMDDLAALLLAPPTDAEWQEEAMRLAHAWALQTYYKGLGQAGYDIDGAKAALRAHIATRPQGDGWIACSESLPAEGETCLVALNDGTILSAWPVYWHGASNAFAQWSFPLGEWPDAPVTHWRPLPAPPTKKEQP